MRASFAAAMCLIVCGCGPSAAQRWSDLPFEEKMGRLTENLERGECHVAPLEGDLTPAATLPRGEPFRAFGEIRCKDPKASMLSPGIVLHLFRLEAGGAEVPRDKLFENDFEEPQPGIYRFTKIFDSIDKPGRYTIRLGPPGEITIHTREFENRMTADEFTVE